jgi:hypothetical protein
MSIQMRNSLEKASDTRIFDWTKKYAKSSNEKLYEAVFNEAPAYTGSELYILLTGARDLPGVSVRRAQSALRWDMRPSLWSESFILQPDLAKPRKSRLFGVPLYSRLAEFPRPERNGVVETTLSNYLNAKYDANVALLIIKQIDESKTGTVSEKVGELVQDPNRDRARFNFWESLSVWQSYLWSFGLRPNPLREGWPVPSASFIEYCCEGIGLDITPGASTRNTAPEHIWNTAKYWGDATHNQGFSITGYFIARDKGCSLRSSDEDE